jgi:hypothetical protein
MPGTEPYAMPRKVSAALQQIECRILNVRGCRVMLDVDLAALYRVEVRALNQAVRRNLGRFPGDFMFQLTDVEVSALRSQIVILKDGRGTHRKYRPYAFTEHGVAMLSSVLRSARAIEVNIEIVRAFVRLRRSLHAHADLGLRVAALERKYDARFKAVFEAIRQIMTPAERPRQLIGFRKRPE